MRLHREAMAAGLQSDGRLAAWLGARLGGDAALGERAWRRILHGAGAFVLLYFVLPSDFFIVISTTALLLVLLAAVIVLEVLRHLTRFALGLLRPYETQRIGSYVFYAIALTVAVLLFPPPIATVVVLGVAFVDPLTGELRLRGTPERFLPLVPLAAYTVLGATGLLVGFHWTVLGAFGMAFILGAVAVAVEQWRIPWLDDDLSMTLIPGVIGAILLYASPGFSSITAGPLE